MVLLGVPIVLWAEEAPATPTSETVTVSRSEFEALKAAVTALQREVQQLRQGQPGAAPAVETPEAPPLEVPVAAPMTSTGAPSCSGMGSPPPDFPGYRS